MYLVVEIFCPSQVKIVFDSFQTPCAEACTNTSTTKPLPPRLISLSLDVNLLQAFQGRVHIYFVSHTALSESLSSRWSRIKGSAPINTPGHVPSRMHKNSQAPASSEEMISFGWIYNSDGFAYFKSTIDTARNLFWPHSLNSDCTEAALFDARQRQERACGIGTTFQQNGSLIALFHEAWWCRFPFLNILIPVLMHSGKLVPMNTHWFASMMINWYNTLDC